MAKKIVKAIDLNDQVTSLKTVNNNKVKKVLENKKKPMTTEVLVLESYIEEKDKATVESNVSPSSTKNKGIETIKPLISTSKSKVIDNKAISSNTETKAVTTKVSKPSSSSIKDNIETTKPIVTENSTKSIISENKAISKPVKGNAKTSEFKESKANVPETMANIKPTVENESNTKPVKLGPLALYKAKLADKKLKELAKKEAKNIANKAKSTKAIPTVDKPKSKRKTMKQISINYDNKVKAFQDKLASGKVKMNPPMSITLPTVDEDVDTLLKKFESQLPKAKDPLKEYLDKYKDDKDD
jgi:hypothetical protein